MTPTVRATPLLKKQSGLRVAGLICIPVLWKAALAASSTLASRLEALAAPETKQEFCGRKTRRTVGERGTERRRKKREVKSALTF